jgi:hypothetical protein
MLAHIRDRFGTGKSLTTLSAENAFSPLLYPKRQPAHVSTALLSQAYALLATNAWVQCYWLRGFKSTALYATLVEGLHRVILIGDWSRSTPAQC